MEMVKAKRISSWFDWVIGWDEYKDYPNVIFMKYEDMKKDPESQIRNLAKFLKIDVTDDVIADLCNTTCFQKMKDGLNSGGLTDKKISPFARKGDIGDWKNYFCEASNVYIQTLYKDVESVGLHFEFE